MYNRGDCWYFDPSIIDTSKWSVSNLPGRTGLYRIIMDEKDSEYKHIILYGGNSYKHEWTVTREFLAKNFIYSKVARYLYG